jgi:hypothetical protein
MNKLIAILLCPLAFSTYAKDLYDYQSSVQFTDQSTGLGTSGWSCQQSVTQSVVEGEPDYAGKLQDVTWSSKSTSSVFAANGATLALSDSPKVDLDHLNSRLEVTAKEDCSQDYTTKDEDGKTQSHTRTTNMTWECRIDAVHMPVKTDCSQKYQCRKGGKIDKWKASYNYSDAQGMLFLKSRQKNVDMDLTLKKTEPVYKDY